jgi:hypothetical protein
VKSLILTHDLQVNVVFDLLKIIFAPPDFGKYFGIGGVCHCQMRPN